MAQIVIFSLVGSETILPVLGEQDTLNLIAEESRGYTLVSRETSVLPLVGGPGTVA